MRQAFLCGILVLFLGVIAGCSSSDSGAETVPQWYSTAGNAHMQRVTLRITGMS